MTEAGIIPTPEDRSPRDPLRYECGFCGARPGEPCVNTVTGRRATLSHYPRTPREVREGGDG